jgi:hypothetical protein
MRQAIRQRVTIQPGGRVGTIAPELTAGNEAGVIILEELSLSARCLADLVGSGKGAFSSPEEADSFIRRERGAWG